MKNKMYLWSRKVRERQFQFKEIEDTEINEVHQILDPLLEESKEEKNLNETKLSANCKDWIKQILEKYPNKDEEKVKYLLNDFTDSLMTRMREQNKYAIALQFENILLICHSDIGERTITPKFEIIERMLDRDNINRYVAFSKRENNIIGVKSWEYYASKSLEEWLGLSCKEIAAFLTGKVRIHTEAMEFPFIIELNDEETERFLEKMKIEGSIIQLPHEIKTLPINDIRMGRKRYKDLDEFREDFYAKRFDLYYYIYRYKELYSGGLFESPNSGTFQYFEDESRIVKIHKEIEEIVCKKTNPKIIVLFADGNIKIREKFLELLFSKVLNKERVLLFHAGEKLAQVPTKVNNLEIFNEIKVPEYIKVLIDFTNDSNIIDGIVRSLSFYTTFVLLHRESKGKRISYIFKKLAEKFKAYISELIEDKKICQIEDRILELKSSDILNDNNKKIIEFLSEDMKKKLEESSIKFYIIGVDEKTRKLEPIPSGKFGDDRISTIKEKIEERLKKNLHIEPKLHFIKIPVENGRKFILLMICYIKKHEGEIKSSAP